MDKRIKKLILLIFNENTPVCTPSTPKKSFAPFFRASAPFLLKMILAGRGEVQTGRAAVIFIRISNDEGRCLGWITHFSGLIHQSKCVDFAERAPDPRPDAVYPGISRFRNFNSNKGARYAPATLDHSS
ncbi:hypothetical protein GEV33_005435 [Tenebrio molitor]|uniref:Uncharacterized protein n=1 Tax=Tenebrio molitor TaxID=7067 RepID=A0A8J6LLV6_TENMO|nr:hypothetical protein GEV33_005435 [Tenebrio molitor]